MNSSQIKFQAVLESLPSGSWRGHYNNVAYIVSKSHFSGGKSIKLVANEMAGSDYISLNYYLLSSGENLLKPCEMPKEKVMQFVLGLKPDL